jgi:hypothetical protein
MEDELGAWRAWLESSSPPETSIEMPQYEPADTILSPEMNNYDYFMIESFAIDGETIFLTDGRSGTLLAYTMDGELLWKTGGQGEGPGLFCGVGEVAASGDTVAVCNHGVGRVDFFNSQTGDWLSSVPVLWPFDLAFLPDGNIVVASMLEANLISILTPEGEVYSSCGKWDAPGDELLNNLFATSNRNIHTSSV